MSKLLAIGIASIDIINQVNTYPDEDSEVRAYSQHILRGGNATNTLAILSQLGMDCYWAGTIADDSNKKIITDDLDYFKIDYSHTKLLQQGINPTSYILVSSENASRSIVHYRDLVEYNFNSFRQIKLKDFDWLHFEGRNIQQLLQMLDYCKNQYPQLKISVEIEKNRPEIELLFAYADVLLFSKPYALSKGFNSGFDFLTQQQQRLGNKIMTCTWGEVGADLYYQGKIYNSPAFPPEKIIDTLAAGDTFNAAVINSLLLNQSPQKIISNACRLAGRKCGKMGLELNIT
ncbi:MAG: PfkB family carbohydrate kinase [Pseudomonadota bacterium]